MRDVNLLQYTYLLASDADDDKEFGHGGLSL